MAISIGAGEARWPSIQAAGPSQRDQCTAHFFIGLDLLADGDRPAARKHFQASLDTHCFYFTGYDYSRAFLARMAHDPNWPTWIRPTP